MKVGILTGGGDCPGLNAVIRAAGRRVMTRGGEVVGVLEGWKGLVEGLYTPLGPREISGLLPRGGTILRTTRTNPFKVDGGVEKVLANFEREGFDSLVAIGGEDTLGVAARLYEEHGFPVVGVPKTIDNDLSGTTTRSVRHRRLHRDRGDRPAAHDGRVAQSRHGRGGHGPEHGL